MKIFVSALGRALLVGAATFSVIFFVSCASLTAVYEREAPHDGQNGMAAFFVGVLIAGLIASPTLLVSFLYIYIRRVDAA